MQDNSGDELDHADDVCMRSKKNSPSISSCIGKRTVRLWPWHQSQVDSQRARWGRFLWGNWRNLAEERVVRKTLSPGSITGMPYLCNDQGQWAGNMGKGERCFGFGESASSLPRSPTWPGTQWKLRATRERESERSQISHKDLGWRNAIESVNRRARADWELVRKRADWQWHFLTPFQAMYQCKGLS